MKNTVKSLFTALKVVSVGVKADVVAANNKIKALRIASAKKTLAKLDK